MANDHPGPSSVVRRLESVPTDLAAVIAIVLLVNVTVFTPVVRETPLRVPFVLAFVLFVPGYVVVAAMYPESQESAGRESDADSRSVLSARLRSGIGAVERVALAFGLSFVIVPAVGFPLTRWYGGIRLVPITATLTAFTLLVAAIAVVRRWNVPEGERFSVPYRAWIASGRSRLRSPESRIDTALTALLVISILLVAGTIGFAATTLPQEDEFSSISLLVETDEGELVADDFPTEMDAGESEEFVVVVDNHEHRTAEYTLVVAEQSLESVGDEPVVDEQRELDRFEARLDHNETERLDYELEPTRAGDDVRVAWLLYVDEEPTDPSVDDAPYYVDLVVDVE